MTNPTVPGNFDGPMPPLVAATNPAVLVRYTNTDQFPFFKELINFATNQNQYTNGANVRLDTEDGQTIRWYWAYWLPFGFYLLNGRTTLRPDQVANEMRPVEASWPDNLADVFGAIPGEVGDVSDGILDSGSMDVR